ncbi:TPA: hypothetical protein ACGPMR_003649 [Yersinia enterocolitica]|nr:hypothetical protein [Yersinia enterocolitica]
MAGVEPASIGALPIAVRAAVRYMTSIFTVAYLLALPLSFTTSQTYLVWLFALFSARLSFNFLSYFWRPAVLMDLI